MVATGHCNLVLTRNSLDLVKSEGEMRNGNRTDLVKVI